MKIQLDKISVHLENAAPCRTVSLRLVVDNAEMVTEVLAVAGKELIFPDIYEFALDELVFASGTMPIDVDFFSMDSLEAQTIGSGGDNMCTLFQVFNQHVDIMITMMLNQRRVGVVRIRGRISNLESCFELLKSQQDEIVHLKDIYEKLAGASRALEQEAGDNLLIAQGQIEKLTKKHNDLVVKYNDLLNMFEGKDNEFEDLRVVLQQTEERLSIVTVDFEREHALVDQLQDQLDNMTVTCEREQQMCEKQEQSLQQHEKEIEGMQREIDRLNSELHNKSIVIHNQYIENIETTIINNTFIENIVNNITNNYITNIIETGDADALRKELLEQLQRFEMLRQRHAKLSKRLSESASTIQIYSRVRPPSADESSGLLIVDHASFDGTDVALFDPVTHEWAIYDLDRHFEYDADQASVFDEAEPLVAGIVPTSSDIWSLTSGKSSKRDMQVAAIMAYGAHGSGKTFTLHGFGAHAGLSYRTLQKLFELLELQKLSLELLKTSTPGVLTESQRLAEYKYDVKLAFLEVFEDKVYDLSVDDVQRRNLIPQIRFHGNRVVVDGLQRQSVVDSKQAMKQLAMALKSRSHSIDKSGIDSAAAILVEISISVKFLSSEPALESQFWFADLPSFSSPEMNDTNLVGFHHVIDALEARRDIVPFSSSPLTTLLQGCFAMNARSLIVFTLAPTDRSYNLNKSTLELSCSAHKISRPQPVSGSSGSVSSVANKHNDLKLKSMTTELTTLLAQKSKLEESIRIMKSAATDVVRKFHERNEIIVKHYMDEKDLCKQLYLDLELTNQNLKRTIADLRDQRIANERLAEIIRALEKERETLVPKSQ